MFIGQQPESNETKTDDFRKQPPPPLDSADDGDL
uniref:Uncharacterized protein n=1 Tax=Setaria digitata TaxID=48799 RepID=A0A915PX96_9BILA